MFCCRIVALSSLPEVLLLLDGVAVVDKGDAEVGVAVVEVLELVILTSLQLGREESLRWRLASRDCNMVCCLLVMMEKLFYRLETGRYGIRCGRIQGKGKGKN